MSNDSGAGAQAPVMRHKNKSKHGNPAAPGSMIHMHDIQPDLNGNQAVGSRDVDEEAKNVTARKSVLGTLTARSRRPNTMKSYHHHDIQVDDNSDAVVARVTDPADLKDNTKVRNIRRAKSLIIDDEEAKLKRMPAAIEELTDMTHLAIKMSKIKKVPEPVVSRKNLKSLHITETQLMNMEGVCRMPQLKELELTGNKIGVIPKSIGNLINLEILDLSGNHIMTVVPEIGQLKSLKRLYLTANKIMKLPEGLCELASLEVLDISRNKMTEFPQNLGSMATLVELTASHNKISSFPASMASLKKLKHLAMTKNTISVIPAFFDQLVSVTHISLNMNDVRTILSLPPAIESLLLDGNNVEEIETFSGFPGATTLKVLSLRQNPIKRLPEALSSFRSLHALYLDGTQIDFLPDALRSLQEIRHLSLQNTRIRTLPEGFERSRLSVFAMDTEELAEDPEGQL